DLDNEVFVSIGDSLGRNWKPPVHLSDIDSINSYSPSIAGDDAGHEYVVWSDDLGGIFLRRSTDGGGSWMGKELVSGLITGFPLVVARNSWVAILGNDSSGSNVFKLSQDFGNTWSSLISLNSVGYASDIALQDSIIHTAWAEYFDGGKTALYYR